VDLYRGPLLPGFYEEWALHERTRLEQAFAHALRDLIITLETLREFDRALPMALRWVAVDPLTEEAHMALMRLYAATGQLPLAKRQFRDWARLLQAEMGEEPSGEAQALLQQLLENPPGSPSPFPTTTPTAARSASPQTAGAPPTPSHPTPTPSVSHASRLPLQLTRFFGREQELTQLQALLRSQDHRLLTLTGPGGTGKTRLALEVAQRLTAEWQGPLWFVPLADLTEAERLPDAIARAIGLRLSADFDALDQIVEALSACPTLLILDNFEQLPEEAAERVQHLLQRLPLLTCLVTSRHLLKIGGEQEFPIAPLPTPQSTEAGKTEATSSMLPSSNSRIESALLAYPSVQMFVDRARQSRPDFQLTTANAEIVSALCRQLEGIPLAIELTAAWAQMLTPTQMLERLNRRFDLLTSRRKDLPPRHRTLRATLEWSFRLLSPELQQMFARLCIFHGGWALEAAEALCRREEQDAFEESMDSVLLTLSLLVERSLILAEESGEGMRYRLLETLREYGREQLTDAERREMQARHLGYFLELAEQAERALFGPDQVRWMDRLEQEHDNLRAALRFCQHENDRHAGLRLAGGLTEFWHRRGHAREGSQWLETFLALPTEVPPDVLAKALLSLGSLQNLFAPGERVLELYEQSLSLSRQIGDRSAMARVLQQMHEVVYFQQRDAARSVALLEQSLALCRAVADLKGVAETLLRLGNVIRDQGDYPQANALYGQSLALNRQIGDRYAEAHVLGDLGYMHTQQGEYLRAITFLQEGLAISREIGHIGYTGHLLWLLGRVKEMQAEYSEAQTLLEEAVQIGRKSGGQQLVFNALTNLGIVAELQQDYATALTRYTEALGVGREMGSRWAVADSQIRMGRMHLHLHAYQTARTLCQQSLSLWQEGRNVDRQIGDCLMLMAQIALAQKETVLAARLFGAAEACRESLTWPMSPAEHEVFASYQQACRNLLDDAQVTQLWAEGSQFPLSTAITLALTHPL
ncbi:MAG: putative ATPase, partial [Chthonomonadales bacterium]|nr:putative ATPase [Chthonomonadales bacterium]